MLKCHNLLVRLFQNGTGGHQVISKNQACQEICCHVLTCARSTTANRQSPNSLLGLSQRVSTRRQKVPHVCRSHRTRNLMSVPVLPYSSSSPLHEMTSSALLITALTSAHQCTSPSSFIISTTTTCLAAPWRFAAVKR